MVRVEVWGLQLQGETAGDLRRTSTDAAVVNRAIEIVVDLHLVVDLAEDRQPAQLDLEPSVGVDVPLDAVFLSSDDGLLGAYGWQKATKRGVDFALAVVSLLILSPLFLITAVAIKATSPGPVFFAQHRIGKDGERFRFLKFRTMYVGAEGDRDQLFDNNEADGPVFKIRDDPRLTRSGKILRRLSIDELPQLVHVISGRMSLVGPRPPLPEEVDSYGVWERQRLLVKPGITCIWQTSGRSDLDFHTWMEMDVVYIQSWSLLLDWKLLAMTIPAVLSGRGAY